MAAGYRAMGPRNAVLPQATATVIGFMRNPDKYPYQKYVQFVPLEDVSNGLYRFPTIHPDDPARLVNYAEFAWGWDDPRPAGEGFKPRVIWTAGETSRYSFGYALGQRTQNAWSGNTKINPQNLYNKMRLGHAMLHRASRVVDAVRGFAWPSYNTATLQTLLGSPAPAVYFDQSSGNETLPSGLLNPNFQIIKRTQNIVMRRLDLLTNGALTGNEFQMVMGPKVAQRVAEAGEIVNYLKQNSNSKQDLMSRNSKWGIPDNYNGWEIVVEDTARVFSRPSDPTTSFADPTNANTKIGTGAQYVYNDRDYVWNDDTILFTSRVGGLDGSYGDQNFSTIQLFHYNGLAQVYGETDQWNQILKGAIDTEDDIKVVAPISGFKLTNTLSVQ